MSLDRDGRLDEALSFGRLALVKYLSQQRYLYQTTPSQRKRLGGLVVSRGHGLGFLKPIPSHE